MTPLFFALAGFLTLDFLLDLATETLNLRQRRDVAPPELEGVFPAEKLRESQAYLHARTRLGLARRAAGLVFLLGFVAAGGMAALEAAARGAGRGLVLTGLLFFGGWAALQWTLGLPFALRSTFGVEARFGFNRTTPAVFWSDQAKALLLTLVLGAPALAGVLAAFLSWGDRAWLYAWAGLAAFQLFVAFVAPAWIMPLFNRFSPLPPGPLRDRIEAYARAQSFSLAGIFTMDGSRRSSKSNAFFAGFGRFRRLVFFDTLLERHGEDELMSVLAHEIGHYRLKHIPRTLTLALLTQGALFWAVGRLIGEPALHAAFGLGEPTVHAGLLFLGILYGPFSRLVNVGALALSRRHEFEADAYAARTAGGPAPMIAALRRLSADNLSDLSPHPLKVALEYSHPPVARRIEALRALATRG
jgi:STE24 endopeptidase